MTAPSTAPYALGVDLGTTYTAAAIRRGERLEIVDLGTHGAAIPSVVYLRDDGTVLTGEAAVRRGATDPGRLSREFKRRMGDTTAILLGGAPYSVDALMAALLRSVVGAAVERQGARPAAIAIAHPANWGQYKLDLLDQAVRRADLDGAVLVTEPEAAAIHYATLERLEPGATVAVYDLGGGTFDVAVLRKTVDAFELLGKPEGIERLGGIDFDEAVFRHVTGALGGALDGLDPDDPVALAAVSRLRDECVRAKEALSSDTEVSVPVLLPNVQTEVRLTRAEFEAKIRPALGDTLVVLRRTLRSAGVGPEDVHSVLLVGGSSRIPLISQMVAADLGRPVALDVHPKHSVALGAAMLASGGVAIGASRPGPAVGDPSMPASTTAATEHAPPAPSGSVAPIDQAPDAPPAPPPAAAPSAAPTAATPAARAAVPAPVQDAPGPFPDPGSNGSGAGEVARSRRGLLVAGAIAAAAVIAAAVILIARPGGGDTTGATGVTTIASTRATPTAPASTGAGAPATTEATVATTAPAPTSTAGGAPGTTAPPLDPCAGAGEQPCIVVEAVRVVDTGAIEVTWAPRNFTPDVVGGFHAHLYWNTGRADQASSDAPDQVPWDAVDATVHTSTQVLVLGNRPPEATGVCATVGIAPAHTAFNPDLFHCLPLPDGAAG